METIQGFIYFQIVRFFKLLPKKSRVKTFFEMLQLNRVANAYSRVQMARKVSPFHENPWEKDSKKNKEFPSNLDGKRTKSAPNLSASDENIELDFILNILVLVLTYQRKIISIQRTISTIFSSIERISKITVDNAIIFDINNKTILIQIRKFLIFSRSVKRNLL